MPDLSPSLTPLLRLVGLLPFECLHADFMQRAMLGMLLLCPVTAALGIHVTQFRMAFFSDAIGHSAFAGAALGLLISADPNLTMPAFGVLVGLTVMAVRRGTTLSSDTAIGIVFSAVAAFGLAAISRAPGMARTARQFLYGDILTIGTNELLFLMLLAAGALLFQIVGHNRMLLVALNPVVARARGVRVAFWQYLFAALTALTVMFAVRAVGVLLVTALLVVPAAAARGFARTAGGLFWWAQIVALTSGVAGLLLSAQPWPGTACGATVVLAACVWFGVSLLFRRRM